MYRVRKERAVTADARAQFPRETGTRGEFVRQASAFRGQVTADGSSGIPAAPDRYHLYVSLACPWAHRTIIVRKLKKLEAVIGMTVVDPLRDERGWAFTDAPGCGPDPVNGFRFLSEAYRATDPAFDGRVTVPVLWDKAGGRIVNNESAEITRMLNSQFDAWGDSSLDLYPEELKGEIDAVNARVYAHVNNGVYRCGFATSQEAYDEAFSTLFQTLDWLEERLAGQRYLAGNRITEADWRLFTTLVRFDAVYVGHFKCNRRRIADYPNLWAYARELYQVPGVAGTVNLDHIKRHYYVTHRSINPTGVVPVGPEIDFTAPHGRA
jgi:putative glutathione S-transferase